MRISASSSASALLLLPLALGHLPGPHSNGRRMARTLHDRSALYWARAGGPIPEDAVASAVVPGANGANGAEGANGNPSSSISTSTSVTSSSLSTSTSTSTTESSSSSTATPTSSTTTSTSTSTTSSSTSTTTSSSSTTTDSSTSSAPIASSSTSSSSQIPPSTVVTSSVTPSSSILPSSSLTSARTVTHVTLVSSVHPSASASATAATEASSSKSGGLSHTGLIVIIVVAASVALAAAGWTAFRKWKLRPSNRFDDKLKPVDFSPHNDGLDDDFLEKTLHRSNSTSSAAGQRQQFVSELDHPGMLHGVPEHDFTAGPGQMAGQDAVYDVDMYNRDPYAHQQQYDYEQYAYQNQQEGYPVGQQHVYPPGAAHEYPQQDYDYPTQDQEAGAGYADVHRGNSTGGSAHGHGASYAQSSMGAMPDPASYLGRPTGGSDGPYAQAAQYRGY